VTTQFAVDKLVFLSTLIIMMRLAYRSHAGKILKIILVEKSLGS
jgi:hypothetical protein